MKPVIDDNKMDIDTFINETQALRKYAKQLLNALEQYIDAQCAD
jgi:hypothetical protein